MYYPLPEVFLACLPVDKAGGIGQTHVQELPLSQCNEDVYSYGYFVDSDLNLRFSSRLDFRLSLRPIAL